MIYGTVNLLRWLFGKKSEVPDHVKQRRLAVCYFCPSQLYERGVCVRSRGGCGCVLEAKTEKAYESCPRQHWTSDAPVTRKDWRPTAKLVGLLILFAFLWGTR